MVKEIKKKKKKRGEADKCYKGRADILERKAIDTSLTWGNVSKDMEEGRKSSNYLGKGHSRERDQQPQMP